MDLHGACFGDEVADLVRRAGQLGPDVLAAPDPGAPSSFPALSAAAAAETAAAVSPRLRPAYLCPSRSLF